MLNHPAVGVLVGVKIENGARRCVGLEGEIAHRFPAEIHGEFRIPLRLERQNRPAASGQDDFLQRLGYGIVGRAGGIRLAGVGKQEEGIARRHQVGRHRAGIMLQPLQAVGIRHAIHRPAIVRMEGIHPVARHVVHVVQCR